jgi:hypothetical protein
MSGQIPQPTWIFRIVHINNVEFILNNGMFTKNHPNGDPNYVNIGDTTLISQRNNHPVSVNPPNGTLGEYVPFYFGPLSPMLYNIFTGHRGIKKLPQDEIIYICCKVDDIIESNLTFCFTNGHAKNNFTSFYNNIDQLSEVDWNIVYSRQWNPIEEDMDRMRRKQAEFLIKDMVPVLCIKCIVVFNEDKRILVDGIIQRLGLKINVIIKKDFYY